MTQEERIKLREWQRFITSIRQSTSIDDTLSFEELEKKRLYLEKHPIEWITYLFPNYAKYEFTPFHKRAIMRIIQNDEWFETISWSRELAKSTITMFCVLYLVLTKKKKNIILTSNNEANAIRLLDPYRANLEANERIKQLYGEQQTVGDWSEKEFACKCGAIFWALGAGQSPRGSKNESIRPDCLLVDDFDTDEDTRNPDIIDKRWEWWEKALYPTRSISEPTTIVFCGNIIAKDCCVVRAGAMADHWDIVNIRDENGKSTWPQKNTEELIDRVLSKISTKAAQGEYFNNPITEGEIFKNVQLGKIPPLNRFKFLVVYGDPAPGENKTKNSSTKAVWLCGKLNGILYIIKGFLNRGLNADFINWYVSLDEYVQGKTTVYNYMENNKLQDPFFQQVFKPLVYQKRKELGESGKPSTLNILPDTEKKTDKATRIESNLEPLDREGKLIFNIAEEDNPDMQRLIDQFKLFTLKLKYPADGPDCIEGANRILDKKQAEMLPDITIPVKAFTAKNRRRL